MKAILRSGFLLDVRRKRFFVIRSLVVGLPLLTVFLLATISVETGDRLGTWILGGTSFMLLCMILLVAPGFCAPVLAEERRNNKLAVLRAGPASAGGVVLGRWLGRVGVLGLCVLAALPVCAAALVFGGVTPAHFYRVVVVEVATLLWVSAVAFAAGARTAQPGAAVRTAYGLVFGIVLLGFLVSGVAGVAKFAGPSPTWLLTVIALGHFANPFSVLFQAQAGPFGLQPWGEVLPYALASVVLAAVLLPLSTRWLLNERRAATAAAGTVEPAARSGEGGDGRLRPVAAGKFSRRLKLLWTDPVFWLEWIRGPRAGRSRVPAVLAWTVILGLEAWFLSTLLTEDTRRGFAVFQRMEINYVAAGAAMILALLAVAGAGCGAFHRESETRTAEVLHAAPRTDRDFVRAKLLGTLRVALPAWLLSVIHAGLGLCGETTRRGPLGFFGYVTYSAILVLALAAFALSRSLTSRNSAIAAFRTFGGIFLWCVVLPLVVGFLFARHTNSEGAGGFLLGWHPGIVLYAPLLMAHEGGEVRAFAIWPLLYGFAYLAYALAVINGRLPEAHGALRRGERPWEKAFRLTET